MIVLKFGGTSVGSVESIKEVANIVNSIKEPKVVVLSAMSGTTNALLEIADLLAKRQKNDALEAIERLQEKYEDLVPRLYADENIQNQVSDFILKRFDFINSILRNASLNNIDREKVLVAQGEILSTNLFQFYLSEINVNSSLVSALDFMRIDEEGEPDSEFISLNLNLLFEEHLSCETFITQGFICKNPSGNIDNLKRGGSDYTASLIGAAINADEIQIWTDIDGMHNNDPRFVEDTFSIEEISFDEAAELAYFGAKILHPQSVFPAKEKNIPVWLKNTFKPNAKGTVIRNCSAPSHVRAIAAKDGITAIKIKSYRMLMAYGFLKNVFEVFENHQTSIDMITTSEVAVSLTIDDSTYLAEIIEELNLIGKVEVDTDQSIICVAGDFAQNRKGISGDILNSLKEIPIRMISYGGSNYNVSLLVKTQDKTAALNALNKGLFQDTNVLIEA